MAFGLAHSVPVGHLWCTTGPITATFGQYQALLGLVGGEITVLKGFIWKNTEFGTHEQDGLHSKSGPLRTRSRNFTYWGLGIII